MRRNWYQLRRLRRRFRGATRDNSWLLPLIGAVLGLVLAGLVGTETDAGTSWTITVDRSRDTHFGILGLIFTALSIVLALASVAAQNIVGRFGSRTLHLHLRGSPERWVVASYTLSATFVLSQQFQMRKLPSDGPAPVYGLVVSISLLVVQRSAMEAARAAAPATGRNPHQHRSRRVPTPPANCKPRGRAISPMSMPTYYSNDAGDSTPSRSSPNRSGQPS